MAHNITYIDGIVEAQREEMKRDETVFVLGEDVGVYGGVFKATRGLMQEFGFYRCLDTPIAESGIVGIAIGAAMMGMRPIAEIQFADFIGGAHDQIVNQATKIFYRSGGTWPVPITIRIPYGADVGGGMYHSQSIEQWYMNITGLKMVVPSTPYDAKGLLKACIRDNNPCLYLEHKKLYRTIKEEIPEDDYIIPIGKADIKREGKHISVYCYGLMYHRVLQAANILSKEGIDLEIVDLRSLLPLDKETILHSVKKTGKAIVVHEASKTGGVGAEVASIINEEAWDYLDAPVHRECSLDIPMPFHPKMEAYFMPTVEKIVNAARKLHAY